MLFKALFLKLFSQNQLGLKWAVGSGIVLSGLTAVAAVPFLLSLVGFTSSGKMNFSQ